MKNRPYYIIHRHFMSKEFIENKNAFVLYGFMSWKCSIIETVKEWDGHLVDLNKGQLVISRRISSNECGLTVSEFRTGLKYLTDKNMISIKKFRFYSVVSLLELIESNVVIQLEFLSNDPPKIDSIDPPKIPLSQAQKPYSENGVVDPPKIMPIDPPNAPNIPKSSDTKIMPIDPPKTTHSQAQKTHSKTSVVDPPKNTPNDPTIDPLLKEEEEKHYVFNTNTKNTTTPTMLHEKDSRRFFKDVKKDGKPDPLEILSQKYDEIIDDYVRAMVIRKSRTPGARKIHNTDGYKWKVEQSFKMAKSKGEEACQSKIDDMLEVIGIVLRRIQKDSPSILKQCWSTDKFGTDTMHPSYDPENDQRFASVTRENGVIRVTLAISEESQKKSSKIIGNGMSEVVTKTRIDGDAETLSPNEIKRSIKRNDSPLREFEGYKEILEALG